MKTSIKKLPKSRIEILFEISVKEFQTFTERAILNLAQDIEIDGFRKGEAPKEILIEKIGQEKILNSALELAVKKSYFQEIFSKKIEAISQPEIEILSEISIDKGLTFKARFSILPEINLPDYQGIAARTRKKKIVVEENEIEDTLSFLQKSRAKFIFENRPAKKGDFVEIEFQSPQIESGLKRKDRFILGQGNFVLSFEEKLEGMAPGQEKEFSLKFPKDYFQKDLAGNLIGFKVRMNSVQKTELPEINDEFIKTIGKFESLTVLKESIAEGVKQEKEIQESQRIRQEILEKVVENSKMEIPEILIEEEKKKMIDGLKNFLAKKQKISFDDYLAKIKKTEKEILDSFSLEAEKKIKNFLILKEISKREKIEATEEETKKAVNEFLKIHPNIGRAEKELDPEKLKSYYESVIRNEKTLTFLESLTKQKV